MLAFHTPTECRNPDRATAGTFEPLSLARTKHVLAALLLKLWRHYKDRRVMVDLAHLDDRMLADIGITRNDVYSALSVDDGKEPSWHLRLRADERHCAELEKRRQRL